MINALNVVEKEVLVKREGEDFLFLFDLIAHTCGLPATLRVLSYTAPKFERLCQPVVNLERDLELTETSVRVSWSPAPLQEQALYWLYMVVLVVCGCLFVLYGLQYMIVCCLYMVVF